MDLTEFGQDSNMRIIDDKLMMAAMKVAIGQELTQRQMECLAMYFGERLTLKEIGLRLGIGKSTVYKHIETGKAKSARCSCTHWPLSGPWRRMTAENV